MKNLLRIAVLAAGLAVLMGCGGASGQGSPFAGNYSGTWAAVGDPADAGTSAWTFGVDGSVTGFDIDPGRDTTFSIDGQISDAGHLVATATPDQGAPASLSGTLQFDAQGGLAGVLVWGAQPPASYNYVFTRQ